MHYYKLFGKTILGKEHCRYLNVRIQIPEVSKCSLISNFRVTKHKNNRYAIIWLIVFQPVNGTAQAIDFSSPQLSWFSPISFLPPYKFFSSLYGQMKISCNWHISNYVIVLFLFVALTTERQNQPSKFQLDWSQVPPGQTLGPEIGSTWSWRSKFLELNRIDINEGGPGRVA